MSRIDVYHHLDEITGLDELKRIVLLMRKEIMTTQAELAQQLTALGAQLDKAKDEITSQVAALEAAIVSAGNVSQEVEDALAALKSKVQVLDDLNPDAPTT